MKILKQSVNATFYKVPVFSNWNSASAGAGGIGGTCGFSVVTGHSGSVTVDGNGAVTGENAACFTSGLNGQGVNTVGQQIGQVPEPLVLPMVLYSWSITC